MHLRCETSGYRQLASGASRTPGVLRSASLYVILGYNVQYMYGVWNVGAGRQDSPEPVDTHCLVSLGL